MGLEAQCTVAFNTRRAVGNARLEEKELYFRADDGSFRLKIPLAEMKSAEAKRGALTVKWPGGTATVELGAAAEKWALKIRYPKSVLDKLGVKPDSRVAVLGIEDVAFLKDLRARVAGRGLCSAGLQASNSALDFVFFGVDSQSPLSKLASLRKRIQPAGAIWVVWPKGQAHIKEDHVRAAAKPWGLVDVKVVSFSDSLSALKLVIPLANR
jgi:hypothetical protein